MRALHDPSGVIVPAEGVLLGLPARPGVRRRVWLTQNALRKSSRPLPGVFSFYAPNFFLDDPSPWLLPEDPADPGCVRELSALDLQQQIAPLAGADAPDGPLDWTPPSLALFQQAFQDLQAQFQSGWLTKAVPVFFEHAASSSLAPPAPQVARWVSALLGAPETLTPYGCWSERGGVLGASPELLFDIHGGVLRTMALAGTLAAPVSVDAGATDVVEEAFLADPKERREHRLVIEGIADTLAPFGAVTVGETGVLKLPTLWHLQTPIRVALHETPSFERLARSLHPTPALGGSPRDASLQWLRRQDARGEHTAEGRCGFGAPFGVQCPDGDAFCLVAVRNVMWDADTLRIGAGCGIIRESRAEREWEELRQKRESVKRLFGL